MERIRGRAGLHEHKILLRMEKKTNKFDLSHLSGGHNYFHKQFILVPL